MTRLPAALMSVAIWLLPPGRKEWGEAMRGEFDQVTDGHREFGIGCLGASLRENIMTREGWARIAFGGIVVLAALLGLSGLAGLVALIANPPKRPAMAVSSFLVIAGVMLMLAMIARCRGCDGGTHQSL